MDRARLACPHCLLTLRPDVERCACGASFRSLRGILDLRVADDEYLWNEADWQIALALDREYEHRDFRDLLQRYYELVGNVPRTDRDRQVAHILTAPDRLAQWLDALGGTADRGDVLDLGCGPGSTLAALAQPGRTCWGVDIAMRWLILARKRLDEAGVEDVGLACACAERLPFADGSFAAIIAGDVVEHVRDRALMLSEAHRVLAPQGRMVAATPNRFSLAPEPHVGVWGVGFLPRSLMNSYVHWVRKIEFRAIHTMGAAGWTRLARGSPFARCRVVAPELPGAAVAKFSPVKRGLARGYNRAVRSPVGRWLAKSLGPLLHLTFEKADDSGLAPSPATPPRSTPSKAAR